MSKEGILKHKEVFDAWLNGAEIEHYAESDGKWRTITQPNWFVNDQYRVKPKKRKKITFTCDDILGSTALVKNSAFRPGSLFIQIAYKGALSSIYIDDIQAFKDAIDEVMTS